MITIVCDSCYNQIDNEKTIHRIDVPQWLFNTEYLGPYVDGDLNTIGGITRSYELCTSCYNTAWTGLITAADLKPKHNPQI